MFIKPCHCDQQQKLVNTSNELARKISILQESRYIIVYCIYYLRLTQ